MILKRLDSVEDVTTEVLKTLATQAGKSEIRLRGFMPTGSTVKPLYQAMVKNSAVWGRALTVIQIDEFVGQGLFSDALMKSLVTPLNLIAEFEKIDGNWTEKKFLSHIEKTIKDKIDFCILGIGPNGHVGFHEPGAGDSKFKGGKVKLSPETTKRVQGADSEYAYTFGVGSFLRAEIIILIVLGIEKKNIFEKFLTEKPNSNLPATLLKNHKNFYVITDIKE